MPNQIITILCEGPHDVAFLCRIFKTIGFRTNESLKLGEFPPPMNQILKREFEKTNVEELNIQQLRNTLLPANTLIRDENFIFLYSLGGDGKREVRQRLLTTFKSLLPSEEGNISSIPNDTTLAIGYFFDSDNQGINQRISEINLELREVLLELKVDLFENNGEVKAISGLKLGAYIFTGDDNNLGKLEDILIPLMKEDNENLFNEAKDFLNNHFDDNRLFPLKIELNNDALVEIRSNRNRDKAKFDEHKSLIGVVGQLQSSGISNVVCIHKSDFLNLAKISNNEKCQEIINFLNAFI